MRPHHLLLLALPTVASAQLLPKQSAERCEPNRDRRGAAEWLDMAAARVLPSPGDNRVLRLRVGQLVPFWEQSDRMYPPFNPNINQTWRWYSPAEVVEGRQPVDRALTPGSYPSQVYSLTATYSGRDSVLRTFPVAGPVEIVQRENPWMMLRAWRANAATARVTQRCLYRDAWRVVLERDGEKLYLSESDATPIKLERVEPHYLWGQVKAEYLWSTWWGVRGANGPQYPIGTYRLFDGEIYEQIGVQLGSAALVSPDSAPRLSVANALPAGAGGPPVTTREIMSTPDTVRVGENTWLLVTPAYTQTVTLQRDTIYLLDATSSEDRARGDSTVIAKLFPGKHPVVLVVTDLAWPHISGVRFWVARGATIVSHRASEDFLRRVVDRKWTLKPDALERSRGSAKFRFRPVDDSLTLAGGALVVHALHGTSTETAVGVWMPGIRYFWAGDYVQGGGDSPYARDVFRTVTDLRLSPALLGAQHIKLTPWADFARGR